MNKPMNKKSSAANLYLNERHNWLNNKSGVAHELKRSSHKADRHDARQYIAEKLSAL